MSRLFLQLRRPRISFARASTYSCSNRPLLVAMGLFCMNVLGTFIVHGQEIPSPNVDLGRGSGRVAPSNPNGEGLCESAQLLLNADGETYENGYAWRYGGVVPPEYGAFAEKYTTLGEVVVCSIVLDLSTTGTQANQTLDAFLWEDEGGEPGAVLAVRRVDPGTVAFWPSISRHTIALESPTVPSSSWWVGYWGNWPGGVQGWFVAADLDGLGGFPFTKIAPGIGYSTGWQHVSAVWGPTQAIGIGALALLGDLGACCVGDGICIYSDAENCKGTFMGVDSECQPNPCPSPEDGACCLPNGTCLFVNGDFCEENGWAYLGDGVVCSPNPCPVPEEGACCFVDGSCVVDDEFTCEQQDGSYYGDDVPCDPNPCPAPGACCLPNGTCLFVNEDFCEENGGAYLGDGVVCSPNPCPVPEEGACCLVNGDCIIDDELTCEQQDGNYQGDDVPCNPNPCPEPGLGACCLQNHNCLDLFAYQCEQVGGTFLGEGTECATADCPTACKDFAVRPGIQALAENRAAGAGPNAGGTLIFHHNTEIEFTVIGEYCGTSELEHCADAVPRVEVDIPVVFHALAAFSTGSSPRLSGVTFGISYPSCIVVLSAGHCGQLEIPDSDWPDSGSGTAVTWADPQMTEVTEVYWFAAYIDGFQQARMTLTGHPSQGGYFGDDDVPSNLDPIAGYGQIGFFMPGYIPCPGGDDPASGACCLPDGTCIRLTEEDCARADGEYQGDGVLCADTNCVSSDVGACCFPNGECLVMSRAACEGAGGVYMGGGTDCAIPCETIPTIDSSWGSIKAHFGRE